VTTKKLTITYQSLCVGPVLCQSTGGSVSNTQNSRAAQGTQKYAKGAAESHKKAWVSGVAEATIVKSMLNLAYNEAKTKTGFPPDIMVLGECCHDYGPITINAHDYYPSEWQCTGKEQHCFVMFAKGVWATQKSAVIETRSVKPNLPGAFHVVLDEKVNVFFVHIPNNMCGGDPANKYYEALFAAAKDAVKHKTPSSPHGTTNSPAWVIIGDTNEGKNGRWDSYQKVWEENSIKSQGPLARLVHGNIQTHTGGTDNAYHDTIITNQNLKDKRHHTPGQSSVKTSIGTDIVGRVTVEPYGYIPRGDHLKTYTDHLGLIMQLSYN